MATFMARTLLIAAMMISLLFAGNLPHRSRVAPMPVG
jgi:hypothetical protein